MLKKMKAEARNRSRRPTRRTSPQSVLDSSRQIWLAGLGAFSRAQAKARRCSRRWSSRARRSRPRTKQAAMDTAAAARGAAKAKAKEMQAMARRHMGQAGAGVRGPRRARAVEARRLHAERRRAAGRARRRAVRGRERADQGDGVSRAQPRRGRRWSRAPCARPRGPRRRRAHRDRRGDVGDEDCDEDRADRDQGRQGRAEVRSAAGREATPMRDWSCVIAASGDRDVATRVLSRLSFSTCLM